MKRSRIGPKTYAEALAKRTALQRRQRAVDSRRAVVKHSRRDPKHEAWREAVLDRDGYQCRWIDPRTKQRCRRRGRKLHAHHIRERTQRPDLRYDVDNGATLCGQHHDYAHHNAQGRKEATEQGLLGGETYEKARKEQREAAGSLL